MVYSDILVVFAKTKSSLNPETTKSKLSLTSRSALQQTGLDSNKSASCVDEGM